MSLKQPPPGSLVGCDSKEEEEEEAAMWVEKSEFNASVYFVWLGVEDGEHDMCYCACVYVGRRDERYIVVMVRHRHGPHNNVIITQHQTTCHVR